MIMINIMTWNLPVVGVGVVVVVVVVGGVVVGGFTNEKNK